MWKPSWPPAGSPGPSLVLLLFTSLALSGVLAYQAQDAARSHRAASESALRDYAALASEELLRQLDEEVEELEDAVMSARSDAERRYSDEERRLDEFVEEVREDLGRCDCPERLGDFFALDLRGGEMEMREPSLPGALRAWIADTVWVEAARSAVGGERVARLDVPGSRGTSLLFTVVREDDGEAVRAYGLAVDLDDYMGAAARAVLSEVALLPPSLAGDLRDEEMLRITVASAGGEPLLQTGGEAAAATEVRDTLATRLGSYPLAVAVRPEMASRLVIGGLPRSRLPLLVGTFLLTLGLSAVAIVQLRRQQALVRLRSGFIASVSHELRTPLAQIRLFSDLLRSGRLGEEQRARSVRIIGEEAQRLAYLVENVLRFSRAEQRLDRITPEPAELGELAREIVDGFAPLAQARGARIETALEPGAVASLDRDAVRQVLLNLLDNAVKYGPRGQTVRVGVAREGGRVRLRVDDQGPGIPAAERAAVWEPFRRLDRDAESASGGSGIGLAVVRDLVTLHGGAVAIDDAPGGGARFLAWFPSEPSPAGAPAKAAENGAVPV